MAHKGCPEGTACHIRKRAEIEDVSINEMIRRYSEEAEIPEPTVNRWVFPRKKKNNVKNDVGTGFNLVNENIDWAKWSWNPVTGCKHDCEYCYARDIANRFYTQKFEPTFHEYRLKHPYITKIPDELKKSPGRNKVFVCSMADLFGDWVPDEWINKVLTVCADTPQWTYIFLTKNPKRYLNIDFPQNAWIGATADSQERMENAVEIFNQINGCIRFVSCEPFIEPIRIGKTNIDWLIIGGQSKSSRSSAFQPDLNWVGNLLVDAAANDIDVYLKPNLTVIKSYPAS